MIGLPFIKGTNYWARRGFQTAVTEVAFKHVSAGRGCAKQGRAEGSAGPPPPSVHAYVPRSQYQDHLFNPVHPQSSSAIYISQNVYHDAKTVHHMHGVLHNVLIKQF